MVRPKILKFKFWLALDDMNSKKEAGSYRIVIDMRLAVDDFGIDKIKDVIPESNKMQEVLQIRSILCERHRPISLMSHVTKLMIRIMIDNAQSRIRQGI